MNKEEKEAIAHLEWLLDNGILSSEDEPHIETVLNLILKQEKIIESYKEILKWSSRERKNHTMDYVKLNKKNKFGTNGICQDMRAFKRTGKIKYRAYIVFQGKQYSLGSHDSLEEAKKARAHAEEKIKCIKEDFKKEVEKECEE